MRRKFAGTTGIPTNCETMMSDDTMAQDGFEPRPEIETPAPEADPVEAMSKEIAELKDRLLRLAAEMENLRKRMAREIDDTRSYAITKFARDMLTATDSLSRALLVLPAEARETADGPMKSLIDGIELTEREMQRLLATHGVKPIEAVGLLFV